MTMLTLVHQRKLLHMNIRSGPMTDHVDSRVCVNREGTTGVCMLLWEIFCWEILGECYFETDPNIIAGQVHNFMPTDFSNNSGMFQQEHAPCITIRRRD